MVYKPDVHHRRTIRLKGYDYAQIGAYFVTICTHERQCLFGEIVDEEMRLNQAGQIAKEIWNALPQHFTGIALDEYVVMPNHFHGIVHIIHPVGAKQGFPALPERANKPGEANVSLASPLPNGTTSRSLPAIIQNFKSVSTRKINKYRNFPGTTLWQRNYFERIIRNDQELLQARAYIADNPCRWHLDKDNPAVS